MLTKELWFRFVVIILLLLIFVQVIGSHGFSSCDKCSFKYENKTIHPSQLLDIYEEKCFDKKEVNFSDSFTLPEK